MKQTTFVKLLCLLLTLCLLSSVAVFAVAAEDAVGDSFVVTDKTEGGEASGGTAAEGEDPQLVYIPVEMQLRKESGEIEIYDEFDVELYDGAVILAKMEADGVFDVDGLEIAEAFMVVIDAATGEKQNIELDEKTIYNMGDTIEKFVLIFEEIPASGGADLGGDSSEGGSETPVLTYNIPADCYQFDPEKDEYVFKATETLAIYDGQSIVDAIYMNIPAEQVNIDRIVLVFGETERDAGEDEIFSAKDPFTSMKLYCTVQNTEGGGNGDSPIVTVEFNVRAYLDGKEHRNFGASVSEGYDLHMWATMTSMSSGYEFSNAIGTWADGTTRNIEKGDVADVSNPLVSVELYYKSKSASTTIIRTESAWYSERKSGEVIFRPTSGTFASFQMAIDIPDCIEIVNVWTYGDDSEFFYNVDYGVLRVSYSRDLNCDAHSPLFGFSYTVKYTSEVMLGFSEYLFVDENGERVPARVMNTYLAMPAAAASLVGDANGDGNITIEDCIVIQRVWVGLENFMDDQCRSNADVNNDGVADILDVQQIRMYIAGKLTSLGGSGAPVFPPIVDTGISAYCAIKVDGTVLPGEGGTFPEGTTLYDMCSALLDSEFVIFVSATVGDQVFTSIEDCRKYTVQDGDKIEVVLESNPDALSTEVYELIEEESKCGELRFIKSEDGALTFEMTYCGTAFTGVVLQMANRFTLLNSAKTALFGVAISEDGTALLVDYQDFPGRPIDEALNPYVGVYTWESDGYVWELELLNTGLAIGGQGAMLQIIPYTLSVNEEGQAIVTVDGQQFILDVEKKTLIEIVTEKDPAENLPGNDMNTEGDSAAPEDSYNDVMNGKAYLVTLNMVNEASGEALTSGYRTMRDGEKMSVLYEKALASADGVTYSVTRVVDVNGKEISREDVYDNATMGTQFTLYVK